MQCSPTTSCGCRPAIRTRCRRPGNGTARRACAYFTKTRAEWDIVKHELREVFVHGDNRFAVLVDVETVHKRTGGHVKLQKIDLVTMKDGKCTSYAELFDTALVERAAGHGPRESND